MTQKFQKWGGGQVILENTIKSSFFWMASLTTTNITRAMREAQKRREQEVPLGSLQLNTSRLWSLLMKMSVVISSQLSIKGQLFYLFIKKMSSFYLIECNRMQCKLELYLWTQQVPFQHFRLIMWFCKLFIASLINGKEQLYISW